MKEQGLGSLPKSKSKICTLASGSSGNSLFIESAHSKILVDAGIGPRIIKKRLQEIGVSSEDIDAVIVTHEHDDHTRAISKLPLPVYVAEKTEPLWKNKVTKLYSFENDSQFVINDMLITPFSIPHDAIDPVGFTIEFDSTKIGLVTDIGSVTGLVIERLKLCNILVLESNHDMNLLYESDYPWELKQRIKGRLGHLSNSQSSTLLNTLYHSELKHVVLAHLSEVNNCPQVAYKEAQKIVERKNGLGVDFVQGESGNMNDEGNYNKLNGFAKIHVAPRKSVGEVINI